MSTDAGGAQVCFAENFRLFGADPVHALEKFNLYKGLTFLAKAVGDLEARLQELESDLYQIKHYQDYQAVK